MKRKCVAIFTVIFILTACVQDNGNLASVSSRINEGLSVNEDLSPDEGNSSEQKKIEQAEPTVYSRYEYISEFSEGLAVFRQDGLYGYLNEKGEVVIPPIYQNAGPFSAGVAAVCPIFKPVWLVDESRISKQKPDFFLWTIHYIDTAGNALYSNEQILKSPIGFLDSAGGQFYFRPALRWRVYDFSEQPIVKLDINGTYGLAKEDNGKRKIERYQDEPIYEVVEWNKNIPYVEYQSFDILTVDEQGRSAYQNVGDVTGEDADFFIMA